MEQHMSVAKRAFAAEKAAAQRYGNLTETEGLNKIAKEFGLSYGTVKRARVIRQYGTDADVTAVLSGKVALHDMAPKVRPVTNPRGPMPRPVRAAKPAPKPPAPAPKPPKPARVIPMINAPPIKAMTQAEVDPDFTGTAMEFTDKYGHVNIMTAEQRATEGFSAWATNMRALARKWRELPEISRPVDPNWLRSPKPYDIAKLKEAVEFLRPKLAEAEALLARAEEARPAQQNGSRNTNSSNANNE